MSYCKENIFFAIFGENIYSSIFLLPYSHQLTVEIKKNKDLEEWIDRATTKAGGSNGNGIICRLYGCLLASGRKTCFMEFGELLKENIFFAIFGENIYSSMFLLPYSQTGRILLKKIFLIPNSSKLEGI